jgi:hypothetical protein
MAEEKLKRGTFNVFEASDLFNKIHKAAMSSLPLTDMSFGSRFMTLLRSSGQGPVKQFFSITGMGSKWVALMFHEGSEQNILPLIRDINPSSWLLAHYLSTGLKVKGLDFLMTEMKNIDRLSAAKQFPADDFAIASSLILLSHTMVRNQSSIDMFTYRDYQTVLEKNLSKSIFSAKAPNQTSFMLDIADLLHPSNPDTTRLLSFVKSLEQNSVELDFWTTNQFRRRLLLEVSLKASGILCGQEKFEDAQYLLHFTEAAFAEELEISEKPMETHNVPRQRRASMKEEQAVLSRLDGLLPS